MSDTDLLETVAWIAVILIGAFGVLMYGLWRMGSEPDKPEDYGAPHG